MPELGAGLKTATSRNVLSFTDACAVSLEDCSPSPQFLGVHCSLYLPYTFTAKALPL